MTVESVDLAIIGGGPAGLSAAREATRLGIRRVVVLEREAEAGGAVRHCGHLGFGMMDFYRLWTGPNYARHLRAATSDIDIRTSHSVLALEPDGQLSVSTPGGMRRFSAQRVLLATGIREKPRAARLVSGARPFGVLTTGALQRIVYLQNRMPCRNPVVIGTELVSFSTLLTLRDGNVRLAAILTENLKSESPFGVATAARLFFGIPVKTGVKILSIEGHGIVEGIKIEWKGRQETIPCDSVIFSGQWVPEASLMHAHPVGIDSITLGPLVDDNFRTGDPTLFAAGNVRFSVRSAGACALEGRKAARRIASDLGR